VAKNNRASGPGGPIATGVKKRMGRNTRTGGFVEDLEAHSRHTMIVQVRSPDEVAQTSIRSDRDVRPGKAIERVEAVMRGAAEGGLTLGKDRPYRRACQRGADRRSEGSDRTPVRYRTHRVRAGERGARG